jgi:hypothetical protein
VKGRFDGRAWCGFDHRENNDEMPSTHLSGTSTVSQSNETQIVRLRQIGQVIVSFCARLIFSVNSLKGSFVHESHVNRSQIMTSVIQSLSSSGPLEHSREAVPWSSDFLNAYLAKSRKTTDFVIPPNILTRRLKSNLHRRQALLLLPAPVLSRQHLH